MAKKHKKLTEKEIGSIVENNISKSVGYYDGELSTERKLVTEYFNAKRPYPVHKGNSKYVSQDVYDAVSAMGAALLETFSAGSNIVSFTPQSQDDVETARVCSEYTDYVVFRQNDGFAVFRDVIHDGLTGRAGIAKVFFQESTEETEEDFTQLTQNELDVLLSEPDVELLDVTTDQVGLVSGTITRARDTSQVVIECIPPEEFLIEARATSLDVGFCCHKTRKTLTELRQMGFSEKKLKSIGSGFKDQEKNTDPELIVRFDGIDNDDGLGSEKYQDQVREVMVYEAYIMLDVQGSGEASLHRVTKAGNTVLSVEPVSRRPFVAFAPLPIPHSFYGSNFAAKLIATQNARTVLTRSILDHAVMTNSPRYMVVKGGLSNPRELIDNRVGGLVNVTRPDAISPMPQAPLNPFVFQTLQLLDEDKEDNTGVSRLSQGLNKDAISHQNSAAMVEQLATMSQQRQKIIARNFASQFLKPLFREVYQLVVENESQEKIVELAGKYVAVTPASWADRRDVKVALHLGYGEQDREAQKLLSLHQLFSTDPNLQPMYTPQNRFEMIKAVLENQGIKNVEDYITPPENIEPQGPDPMVEMQMQMAQRQLELQERQQALAEQKAQSDAEIAMLKLELDKARAEATHALQADNQDLKEEQQRHKEYVDREELKIAREADDVRAIASPTG